MQNSPYMRDQDPIWGMLGIIAGVLFLPYLIWYAGHTYISIIVLQACAVIFRIMDYLYTMMDEYSIIGLILYVVPEETFLNARRWLKVLPNLHYSSIGTSDLIFALSIVGVFLRAPVIICILLLIRKTFKNTIVGRLKREFDIIKLAKVNSRFFPQIRPALFENLLHSDPDKGPFAREMSPIRFIIKHECAYIINESKCEESDAEKQILSFDTNKRDISGYLVLEDDIQYIIDNVHNKVLVDKEILEMLFAEQVGAPWCGVEHLPYYLKGLYACLIAQINSDKKSAEELLFKMNQSYKKCRRLFGPPEYKMSIGNYEMLVDKHEGNREVQSIIKSHAYVSTVFSRLLENARKKGKFACPDFLWLKVFDRPMWYTLNQVGCQTGWTEAAGVFSHFLTEKKAGFAVNQISVKQAVDALIDYIRDTEGWLKNSNNEVDTPF